MNILLILPVLWPYGFAETFLENEVAFADGFDKIYCMPLFNGETRRAVPDRIELVPPPDAKVSKMDYMRGMLLPEFWDETKSILKTREKTKARMHALIRETGAVWKRKKVLSGWLRQHVKADDKVTVYTYWMASDAAAVSILRKRKWNISRFVTRCHAFDLYDNANKEHYLPYRQLIFQNADRIAPISDDGCQYLLQMEQGPDVRKIVVSRLGTLDWGKNPYAEKEPQDVLHIVSCSNLIELKRVDRIIRAMKNVKESVVWHHFGDGKLKAELETLCSELPGHVEYRFMGSVPNRELMQWYQMNPTDLFISTSEREGVPVSMMEAMSFGIPVIATDVGGVGEIVRDGYNGFLMDADIDQAGVTDQIERFFALTPEQRKNMREHARQTWEEMYNAELNYTAFYRDVLKSETR